MNPPWPNSRRYAVAAIGGWLLFLISLMAVAYGTANGWPHAALVVLALTPAVIASLQFFAGYSRIASQDEFVRALFAKRMLVAMAAAVVMATAWSGAEMVGAPHLPAWLLYPLVWGLFGALTPVIGQSKP